MVGWVAFLAIMLMYWLLLLSSQDEQLRYAETHMQLRAEQTAHALVQHTNTMLEKINYLAGHLGEHWYEGPEHLQHAIAVAQSHLPPGLLVQVAIADAQGGIVFSSLDPDTRADTVTVSIADREHFLVHPNAPHPRLFISQPVLGRVSQQWTVQFSRPLIHAGRFDGVIVLSVSPEHLSRALRAIFPDPDDVAMILRHDGSYIARSHLLEEVLGKQVPSSREFLQDPQRLSGHYEVVAPVDGIRRHYAWHRAGDYPAVLSLGLNTDKALAPVHLTLNRALLQNAVGSVLLVLAGVWITWLALQNSRKTVSMASEQLRLTTLLQRFPGGVLMEDADHKVAMVNRQLCALFDFHTPPEALEGLTHAELCKKLGEDRSRWLHDPAAAGEGREKRRTVEVSGPNGQSLEIDWVPIVRHDRQLGRVWLVRDITERKERESMLATLASTDALTGLPNRRSFMAALENALDEVRLQGDPQHGGGALLMLDIDHFKRVNDTHGHGVGDVVLQHVAQLIRHRLRHNDAAGRLGGEEFAVLLDRAGLQDGLQLAERLRAQVASHPAITTQGAVSVTISIGLALLEPGQSTTRTLSRADEALYAAKRGGRNQVQVWEG